MNCSPYLSRIPRTLEEAERAREIREEERSGGVGGGLRAEQLDALDELLCATRELHKKFQARSSLFTTPNLKWAIGAIEETMSDLGGCQQQIRDGE